MVFWINISLKTSPSQNLIICSSQFYDHDQYSINYLLFIQGVSENESSYPICSYIYLKVWYRGGTEF